MRFKAFAFLFTVAALLGFTGGLRAQDSQAPAEVPKRVRVGGNVAAAKMIRQVAPVYPEFAKKDRIQGTVVLHAIIAKNGTVQELQYISGPKELMRAAMDGVRQWTYAPTLLNGEPVEVDTTIAVVFTLVGSDAGAGAPAHAPANDDVDAQLRADIVHMLDVAHVKEQMTQVMQSESQSQRPILAKVFPDTPNRDKIVDRFFEKLVLAVTTPQATDDLVRIYAKYYSDDDVKALTKFYDGPLGQKFVTVRPKVTADSIQWASQIAEKAAPEILQQLCSEYPEIREQAKFCAADSDKKPE